MKEYRSKFNMAYSAPPALAVHLSPADLNPQVSFETFPERLDKRWSAIDSKRFIAALKDFAHKSDFDSFFRDWHGYYQKAIVAMAAIMAVPSAWTMAAWF